MERNKIISSIILALGLLFGLAVKDTLAATLYWVGTDGASASVASNWSTTNPTSCSGNVTPSGSAPVSADGLEFDADCDNGMTIDSGFSSSVNNIVARSGYAGTITLSNPLATVSSVSLSGGTLTGTSSLSVGTAFTLSGGTANMASFTSYSASSTTTATTGTLTFSSTANALAGLTINGGTVIQSAGTFSASGTVNLSSGSLALANEADLNGSLTISGGTFDAPSSTMTLAGNLTVSGGTGTFNANGGTFTIDGSTATIGCTKSDASVISFNLVTFNNSGTKTISSGCVLPLGSNPTLSGAGNVTLSGTLSGTDTLIKTSGTLTISSTGSVSGFSAFQGSTLTISAGTVDFSNYSYANTDSSFNINSSGNFSAPPVMRVGGSFSHTSGTFTHNNGTVILTNSGTSNSIAGSTTFYNLSKTNGTRLSVSAGTTQTIVGVLTLKGDGSTLQLRSLTSGTQWNIDAQGGRALQNLDVQDSNNINSNAMIASSSTDSGNNTGWSFTSAPVISFALDYPGGESHITNTRPTFRWKKATPSVSSSIVKYQLWVDNIAANTLEVGDFSIDNIVPFVSDIGNNNKTIEYGRYTLHDDGDYLNLTTKPSNLWNNTQNDGELTLGKKNWRVVAYDSAGNEREESVDFYVDEVTNTSNTTTASNQITTKLTSTVTSDLTTSNDESKDQKQDTDPHSIPESRVPVSQPVESENFIIRFLRRILEFIKSLFERN